MDKNLFDLSGKVAIVTGSGRGLGKMMALGLAGAGAQIVVCSRTYEEAEATAKEITNTGATAFATRVDTSVRADCEQLVTDTVAHYGHIDVLVNNAGIDIIEPASEVAEEHWDAIQSTNLKGYFNCAQLVGRQMLAQGTGGSIINNSSIASKVGVAGLTAYAAAKGGVDQLTKVMAVEWAEHGIRVNAINGGYFDNVMRDAATEHARPEKQQQVITFTPMRRRGRPDELIGPVVFLASEASSYVSGATIMVDGGYTAM